MNEFKNIEFFNICYPGKMYKNNTLEINKNTKTAWLMTDSFSIRKTNRTKKDFLSKLSKLDNITLLFN